MEKSAIGKPYSVEEATSHLVGKTIQKITEDSMSNEIRIYLNDGKLICLQPKLEVNEYRGIRPVISKNFEAGHGNI